MEQRHRKLILDNIDKLIDQTDYKTLINGCVEYGILSKIMRQNIENRPGLNERAKHKQLIEKITHRGPTAFNQFATLCSVKQFDQAVKTLNVSEYHNVFKSIINEKYINKKEQNVAISNHQRAEELSTTAMDTIDTNGNNTIALEIYNKPVFHDFEVKKSTKIHYNPKVSNYPMSGQNRGVFFMANNILFETNSTRKGAQVDGSALVHLFRELGFLVFYYENLSLRHFNNLLDQLLNSIHVRSADCFVLAITSHGNMEQGIDRVEFSDGAVEELNNVLDKFTNDSCPNLRGKPKIFIFPFCRGGISDRGVHLQPALKKQIETDHITKYVNLPNNIPTYSDMLICYGTVPGFQTHRDDTGSWYVQKLCEIWAQHAHDTNVEDLLKMVGEQTLEIRTSDKRLQTPSYSNFGFNKTLFINPGYYET